MGMVKYVLGAIRQRGSVTVQQLAMEVAAARQGAVKAFSFRHFIGKEKQNVTQGTHLNMD